MKNIKKIKKFLFSVFVLLFMFYIVKEPKSSADIVLRGLNLCYLVIIPVIFPFFAFSKMFIKTSFFEFLARILNKPARFLFGISGEYANAFVIGAIAGFPIGAKTVREVYLLDTANNKNNSKNEAERTLAFCNNCSISFIISAVGIAVFGSFKIGLYLFCIQSISSIITGIIIRFIFADKSVGARNARPLKYIRLNNPEINITETISDSVTGILNICGTVLFFFIITNISFEYLKIIPFLSDLLDPQKHEILSGSVKTAIYGIFEISSGTASLVNFNIPAYYKLILMSIILAWSGFSVHFQILYTIKDIGLSLKPYFTGRLIHVIISVLTTALTFKFFNTRINEVSTAYYIAGGVNYAYPVYLYNFDFYTGMLIFTLIITAAVTFTAAAIMIVFYLFEKCSKNRKKQYNIKV